jgi:hypothetical protein
VNARISLVNAFFANLIGVSRRIEWLPDSNTPGDEEKLAWLWVMRPSLENQILAYAHSRSLITVVAMIEKFKN